MTHARKSPRIGVTRRYYGLSLRERWAMRVGNVRELWGALSHRLRVSALVAICVLSVSHCAAPASPAGREESGPVALLGLEKQSLQSPSIAVRSDTAFIVGNTFSGDSIIARPAYLGRVRLNGDLVPLEPLELPPGDFQFAYPRIAAAGGTLHLVWAEFESPPRTVVAWRALTNRPTSLWHAARERGAWSAPKRIATAYSFGWNGETGGVAVDASGTLHVAAWKGILDSVPHVRVFRLAGERWEDSPLPYTGLNQTTAIATRGDTVVVAAIDQPGDTSRVMVIESTDHGVHWTSPIVASSRLRRQGSVTRMAFARMSDGLLLVIGEKPDDSFYLDTIRVVHLKGATRRPTTRFIDPPETVDGFELAALPCGSVVMLLRTFTLTPQLFELTLAADSSAPAVVPLFAPARIAAFPGIGASQRSAIAVFGYDSANGTPWRTVAMEVRGCSP
jgi:hypothetical protein